jgi:hypothetical protein
MLTKPFLIYLKTINSCLCDFDLNKRSYILNTVWKLAYIYNEFAQLLAHPLQRVGQNEIDFRFPKSPTKSSLTNPSTSQQSITSQPPLSPQKQTSPVKVESPGRVKVETQISKPVEEKMKRDLSKKEDQIENERPDGGVNELEEISKL